MSAKCEMNEPILEDGYKVYAGYWYVVDGEPKQSPLEGEVRHLKREFKATEIRRCDAVARDLDMW